MHNYSRYTPLVFFVVILLASTVLGRLGSIYLLEQYTDDYSVHAVFDILCNLILGVISYVFIKRYNVTELAGIAKNKNLLYKALLLFPLYLVLINFLFADEIASASIIKDSSVLLVLCLSIGFAEEYALRGFLQSYIIKYFANTKKQVLWAVVTAALIFGLLHLVKFDKGVYGELSQVAFATFIGVMFGALLLRTKRLWPLLIIHALIDFAAKIDGIGEPFTQSISKPTDVISAVVIAVLVLPCFIFGWMILRKKNYQELVD